MLKEAAAAHLWQVQRLRRFGSWLCCAQEASAGGLPSDLAILSVAAAQLFEATADWGTEPVVDLLSCLRTVSNRALPSAAQLPGQSKCALHILLQLEHV